MHVLVVEALLIAIYSTGERANTYTHRKTLSVENLSRANSWSLSSCACPCPAVPVQLVSAQLGLSPAGPYQLECTSLRIAPKRGLLATVQWSIVRQKLIS